ncbi:MAG: DUF58 domain-containing protein [Planctomycetota bacterium]
MVPHFHGWAWRTGAPSVPGGGLARSIEPLDTRRYVLAVRKLADSLSHGTDRSRFLGSGVEYVQSRPYASGDPVRAIDWRVTARTGQVHHQGIRSPQAPSCVDPARHLGVDDGLFDAPQQV